MMAIHNKKQEQLYYIEAKKRVKKLKGFYIHLVAYLVTVSFIIWNLMIIEDTPHTNIILAINYSTLFILGFFILVFGIKIFRNRSIFNKKWETKKIKEFLGENKTTWE